MINLLEMISRVEIEGKNIPAMLKCIVPEDTEGLKAFNELNAHYFDIFVDLLALAYEEELVENPYGDDVLGRSAVSLIKKAYTNAPREYREKHVDNVIRLLEVLLNTEVYMVTFSKDKVIAR